MIAKDGEIKEKRYKIGVLNTDCAIAGAIGETISSVDTIEKCQGYCDEDFAWG